MGIEFGDGGIGNPWQVVVTVNSEQDKEYAKYVANLVRALFAIKPRMWKRKNKKALLIVSSSVAMVDFLVSKGAVRGNKIAQKFDIPAWILGKPSYEKAFVRGLVDTDGCLYIHRHVAKGIRYRNIGFCFASFSTKLLDSVANILQKYGIQPHITEQGRRIYLYKADSVLKYLHTFGSSNPRISGLYNAWRGARVV